MRFHEVRYADDLTRDCMYLYVHICTLTLMYYILRLRSPMMITDSAIERYTYGLSIAASMSIRGLRCEILRGHAHNWYSLIVLN